MARRKKKPAVPAARLSTTSGSGSQTLKAASGQPQIQRANKFGRLDGACPLALARSPLSVNMPASSSVTGEDAADRIRQHGPSEVGATRTNWGRYNVRGCIGRFRHPSQPSRPLEPTAMEADLSKHSVSMETTNRCTSSDMSGPLSGNPDGTIAEACRPAGERPTKTIIFISGVSETLSSLACLWASCTGGL